MFIQGGCHFQDSLFFYKIFAVFPKYPAPAAKPVIIQLMMMQWKTLIISEM